METCQLRSMYSYYFMFVKLQSDEKNVFIFFYSNHFNLNNIVNSNIIDSERSEG